MSQSLSQYSNDLSMIVTCYNNSKERKEGNYTCECVDVEVKRYKLDHVLVYIYLYHIGKESSLGGTTAARPGLQLGPP